MSLPTIMLDRVANVSVHGGIVRVGCNAIGPDGQETPNGVLLIPAGTAGPVVTALVKMLQDLAAQQQARLTEKPTPQA
ncbi:MAG: hypothetical protein IT546_11865 [Caulobacteraceae bacterium]|nr:hypothetical protein [Caulobacteraceae bacterium]